MWLWTTKMKQKRRTYLIAALNPIEIMAVHPSMFMLYTYKYT